MTSEDQGSSQSSLTLGGEDERKGRQRELWGAWQKADPSWASILASSYCVTVGVGLTFSEHQFLGSERGHFTGAGGTT